MNDQPKPETEPVEWGFPQTMPLPIPRQTFSIALLVVAAVQFSTAAYACGWWGDGESDLDGDAIVIDGQGRAASTDLFPEDKPEALTREANRLRNYGSPGYAGAARLYRQAAEAGYAPAQNNLGAAYENGLGVITDPVQAAQWYRLAAEQGESHAQHSLGKMLLAGDGVKRDVAQGIHWIKLAATQGHASACADLARFYSQGRYLNRNDGKAIYWWQQAKKFGYPGATTALKQLKPGHTGRSEK